MPPRPPLIGIVLIPTPAPISGLELNPPNDDRLASRYESEDPFTLTFPPFASGIIFTFGVDAS